MPHLTGVTTGAGAAVTDLPTGAGAIDVVRGAGGGFITSSPGVQLREVFRGDPPRQLTTPRDIACCFSESASTACVA